jgi:hypothetical protein
MRLTIALIALLCFPIVHGSARTVTLTATAQPGQTITNTLEIQAYETVELISAYGEYNGFVFQKDGVRLNFDSNANASRSILAGPATLLLTVEAATNATWPRTGAVTLLIKPEVFPPDRTITVAPGIGGAAVTLECSTDLVNWTATTNGVYTNLPAAKFFRIKAERIP